MSHRKGENNLNKNNKFPVKSKSVSKRTVSTIYACLSMWIDLIIKYACQYMNMYYIYNQEHIDNTLMQSDMSSDVLRRAGTLLFTHAHLNTLTGHWTYTLSLY